MTKDSRVYLAHILERIDRIVRYTQGGRDVFLADAMMQDAVVRNLEVIGEAAKRIPDDYRQLHPTIPWRSLAALRDVLIHQYEGVSLPEVWEVVEKHLPPVRAAFVTLLPPLDQLEREIAGDEDV
ncbi:MAG: DUF86 domain-containing protein [Planctomycetota bacterium]